jgi:hypothetical protein
VRFGERDAGMKVNERRFKPWGVLSEELTFF